MNDSIVEAIRTRTIHAGNISFDMLRNVAGKDSQRWEELGRGRAILTTQEQLDQYLYSYGPMTKSQWHDFLGGVTIPFENIRIVDYGCGQGLACALLFDHFGMQLAKRVKEAVLIEPSKIALARAKAIFDGYCTHISSITINKKLDDLAPADIQGSQSLNTIHLFSNVLDIADFDCTKLLDNMLKSKGSHMLLAVSHDRQFQGGSNRFRDMDELISEAKNQDTFSIISSEISQFICSNNQRTISWQVQLEFHRESF